LESFHGIAVCIGKTRVAKRTEGGKKEKKKKSKKMWSERKRREKMKEHTHLEGQAFEDG
jgi:hypothetical protein